MTRTSDHVSDWRVLRDKTRLLLAAVILLLMAACGPTLLAPNPTPRPVMVAPTDPPELLVTVTADADLTTGKASYDLYCAHCHGYHGEGQTGPTVEDTLRMGMNLIPGHNATYDTYQHPDQLLLRVIQEGVSNPLNRYIMPAYGSSLSEAEIMQIINYMKLFWTEEQRAYQARLTEDRAAFEAEAP
jgi:mono/diheme cytochrome c family protein